jgi:hypothetical protein
MTFRNTGLGVDFNFPLQTGFIQERGESVLHEIGLRCPCDNEDPMLGLVEKGPHAAKKRRRFNCPQCGGEGRIYRNVKQIVAIFTGFSENKIQATGGFLYPGDVMMSVIPGYSVAGGDRITITWPEEISDGQVLVRGAAHMGDNAGRILHLEANEDALWYHATKATHCEDMEGHVYYCGSDFILDSSRIIRWVGNQPVKGVAYSIKYFAYLEYLAFMPPVQRRDQDRDFGSRVALRKRHIALLNQDPSFRLSDRSLFCEKLTDISRCV